MLHQLEWAQSVQQEAIVREAFAEMKSAMIHEADIAAVAATALTTDGHVEAQPCSPSNRVRVW